MKKARLYLALALAAWLVLFVVRLGKAVDIAHMGWYVVTIALGVAASVSFGYNLARLRRK